MRLCGHDLESQFMPSDEKVFHRILVSVASGPLIIESFLTVVPTVSLWIWLHLCCVGSFCAFQ